MILVERQREDIHRVVEAVGMWESRRDFQRVWEGWEAGFIAFHAFHTLSFPWSAFRPARLDKPRRHPAQCAAPATKCLAFSVVNEFYEKGCQEKSFSLDRTPRRFLSRDPAHCL